MNSIRTIAFLTVASICALASAADADKKYAIRFEIPDQVGVVQKRTVNLEHEMSRLTKDGDGKLLNSSRERLRFEFVGSCTIESVEKERWTKLRVEVESFEIFDVAGKERVKKDTIRKGTVFTVDRTNTPVKVELAGGKVLEPKRAHILSQVFSAGGDEESSMGEVFRSSTKRSVKETWNADEKQLAKIFKSFPADKEAKGAAELAAVETKKQPPTLVLKTKMSVTTNSPPVAVPGGVGVLGEFDWSQEDRIPETGDMVKTERKTTAKAHQVFKGKPGTPQENWTYDGATIDEHEETIERTSPATK